VLHVFLLLSTSTSPSSKLIMVSNTQPDLQGQQKRDPKKTLATLAPEVLQAPLASPGPQIPMVTF
jgi:hypothetical protein